MRPQQIVVIDIPPQRKIILHEGLKTRPGRRLAVRHVIVDGEVRLNDGLQAARGVELGAQLGRHVEVGFCGVGLDLQPGAEAVALLEADIFVDLGEELGDEGHGGLWMRE